MQNKSTFLHISFSLTYFLYVYVYTYILSYHFYVEIISYYFIKYYDLSKIYYID